LGDTVVVKSNSIHPWKAIIKSIFVHKVDAEVNVLFSSLHFEMLYNTDGNPSIHPITNMTFVNKTIRERSQLIVYPISSILHKFILLPTLGHQDLEHDNIKMAYELEDITPRYF